MRQTLLLTIVAIMSTAASADIQRRLIEYQDQTGTKLTGALYYDDTIEGARPGVIVVHEWWGRNRYAERRARMLAEQGYAAFALDMYGVDRPTEDPAEAARYAAPFRADPSLFRTRARAGLRIMSAQPEVDRTRVGVIGFCFGGTTALELAYASPEIRVAVCFHGTLTLPSDEDAKNLRATILVCNGAADPMVPMAQRNAFVERMEAIGADSMFVEYAGALHAFTNPDADRVAGAGLGGVGYDRRADERSWRLTLATLAEALRD